AVHGSLLKVGQVHGNLGQTAHQESGALHKAQTAIGETHGLRDFFRDLNVGRVEEDVVSDEKLARAHDGCARCRMHAGLAKIRAAGRIGRDLGADAFELPATDVLQILALRRGGGGFVKIDGNLEALPDFFADMASHGDAVFNGDAVDRDEGDDVSSAHAGMGASVGVEVNQF